LKGGGGIEATLLPRIQKERVTGGKSRSSKLFGCPSPRRKVKGSPGARPVEGRLQKTRRFGRTHTEESNTTETQLGNQAKVKR